MKRFAAYISTVAGALLLTGSMASAGGIPETTVTVIGTNSTVRHQATPENRFWHKRGPYKRYGGNSTAVLHGIAAWTQWD